MLREIVQLMEANDVSLVTKLVRDLIDFKIKPKDYNKRVKEVEKDTPKWYNHLPSQGAANFVNLVNYEPTYNRNKSKK